MAQLTNLSKGDELNMKLFCGTKFETIKQDIHDYFKLYNRDNLIKLPDIYIAIKHNWAYIVRCLLADGKDVRAVQFTGRFAGFTALHYACVYGDLDMVIKLRKRYDVDPMAKACDGVEPIHLAAFLGHFDIVFHILKSGVLNNTKLRYSHFKKYALKKHIWETNFGDEIDLFTYGIFNNHDKRFIGVYSMREFFINFPPSLPIRDIFNKSIFLYTIQCHQLPTTQVMFEKLDTQELNERDYKGVTAIHAVINELISSNKFGEKMPESNMDNAFCSWMKIFYNAGANINIIDSASRKLPIHIAMEHNLPNTFQYLLSRQQLFFASPPRPLFFYPHRENYYHYRSRIHGLLNGPYKMQEVFIDNINFRLSIGYPVWESEKALMNQLRNEKSFHLNNYFKKKVICYNRTVASIRNLFVLFGDERMSLYQALMASQKEFNKVARRKSYGFKLLDHFVGDQLIFVGFLESRLKASIERIRILKQFDRVVIKIIRSTLLPYDCLRFIANYIDNSDLENVIKACSN